MYSVIGLLTRPESIDVDSWRDWWKNEHVPQALELPGLLEYVIWPIDEELDKHDFSFGEPSYAGIAVISFESKEAFLAAMKSPTGTADLAHFNEKVPTSQALCGERIVLKSDG